MKKTTKTRSVVLLSSIFTAACTPPESMMENTVEQLYATSSVAGTNFKVGDWKSGKDELGTNANLRNRVSTSFWKTKRNILVTTLFDSVLNEYRHRPII